MLFLVFTCLKCLIIIIPLLIAVAYFTLAERKLLGAIQRRKGPNVIGVFGLLQPLSDGLKLFLKESIIPSSSDKFLFILAPILTFSVSLLSWSVIPLSKYGVLSDIDLSVLYIFAASSLGVYGIIVSGWSSNSKYAFLGALRSAAQMVSYEVSIGFVVVIIVICAGSFNLQQIIHSQSGAWHVVTFLPLFIIFFISALAETNRHPFDLPEAEAELVSGYNVEYAGMGFALFSLGEYTNMLQMSALNTILFFGGWLPFFSFLNYLPTSFWFSLKIGFFVALFIIMRAAFPRYRYDQLMNLGWKTFLPVSLAYLMLTFFTLISFNALPF